MGVGENKQSSTKDKNQKVAFAHVYNRFSLLIKVSIICKRLPLAVKSKIDHVNVVILLKKIIVDNVFLNLNYFDILKFDE